MINISVNPALNNNDVDDPMIYKYEPNVVIPVATSEFGPP